MRTIKSILLLICLLVFVFAKTISPLITSPEIVNEITTNDTIEVSFNEVMIDFHVDTTHTAYNLLDGSTNGHRFMPQGIAVDPEGKIWVGFYGSYSSQFKRVVPSDTIHLQGLYCFMPDGSPAPFSPIEFLEFPDGTKDTLYAESLYNGSCSGLTVMDDGSILLTAWSTLYKFNYQTGEALASWNPPMYGYPASTLTEAAHDPELGIIFIGHVDSGKQIFILDEDLQFIGIAVDSVPTMQRSMLARTVSNGTSQIFVGTINSGPGIIVYEHYIDIFGWWEQADTLGNEIVVTDSQIITYMAYPGCLEWVDRDEGIMLYGNNWTAKTVVDTGRIPESKHAGKWVFLDVDNNTQLGTFGNLIDDTTYVPTPNLPSSSIYPGGSFSPGGSSIFQNSIYTVDIDLNFIQKWDLQTTDIFFVPDEYCLRQNYPNPFNPTTLISYSLPKQSDTKIVIYDLLGHKVRDWQFYKQQAGTHDVIWDAKDTQGNSISSGIYFYSLQADDHHETKKMILLK